MDKKSGQSARAAISISDFKQRDGFTPRAVGVNNPQIPDGTGVGRKPKYTESLDMDSAKKPKHKKEKTGRLKRVMKKSTASLLMIFLLGAGFLLGTAFLRASSIFEGGSTALALNNEIDPSQLKGEGDGRVNVLLLGRGGVGHTAPDLTDTIIVASIDPLQKDAGLVSIPRDLYVQTPSGGSTKINSVYAFAKDGAIAQGKNKAAAEQIGLEAIEKTVEDVTGLPVHYHAVVDFRGFERAINVVDGVDIAVKTPVYEDMVINGKPYTLDVKKGQQHFNGQRALAYSRTRHCLYGCNRGDFDRSERQRQVIVALKDKVLTAGTFGNPVRLAQLFDTFGSHIKTNLSVDDLMRLYAIAGEIDSTKLESVGLSDPPNNFLTTGMLDGLSVVLPTAGANNYQEIHHFLRNKFKDGFIRKEDPALLVLNGTTTPGLADVQRKVLRSYGYRVVGTGDAPSKQTTHTKLIDMRGGEKKYTKRYLELRYKTSAIDDLPKGVDPKDADFVIILGSNETVSN